MALLRYETLVAGLDPPPGPRLNLGSGNDRRRGYVNLDVTTAADVDVVGRLGPGSLPFADGTFSVVLARDVLEHVDVVSALREVHRVTRPGGLIAVSTVHFTSRNLYVDPTHIRGFSVRTLDFFCGGDRSYYFDFAFAGVTTDIQFSAALGEGRFLVWDRLVEPVVNRSRRAQDLYEMTALSRMFPAANVLAVLRR